MYSGQKVPYSPSSFLHAVWKLKDDLASYDQHDAHEVLMLLLNEIHTNCKGPSSQCPCVVHTHFAGQFRSDVICNKCGHSSTVSDAFFDISLDLDFAKDSRETRSIFDCLKSYCKAETLEQHFFCEICKSEQKSEKQLSIKTLPNILSLHLKRFK